MRDKFRLMLFKHERKLFRLMAICIWILFAFVLQEVVGDPTENFLSGKSSKLAGWDTGPTMSGTK